MTGLDWVAPAACTLPTVEQPLRLAEFDALFRDHVQGVEKESLTRARLSLRGPNGLGELVRDLTARESECCSFFTFTITPGPARPDDRERLLLDIEVPAAHADVLTALADRARAVTPNDGTTA